MNTLRELTRLHREPMSKVRKVYFARLIGRCVVLLAAALLWIFYRESFDILDGMNFFKKFSVFHLLWALWLVDMICQLVPARGYISLGSHKHFLARFKPIREKINKEALRNYIRSTTAAAYRVMLLWLALLAVIGLLCALDVLGRAELLMISVIFYVCDLICVLIWCPFRLMMGNRCCTTCRIFNWDHLMMFSPLIFAGGFYSLSLFTLSLAVFAVWELCVLIHPERFWEQTNEALRCSSCTDKLCTQYCRRLRG